MRKTLEKYNIKSVDNGYVIDGLSKYPSGNDEQNTYVFYHDDLNKLKDYLTEIIITELDANGEVKVKIEIES